MDKELDRTDTKIGKVLEMFRYASDNSIRSESLGSLVEDWSLDEIRRADYLVIDREIYIKIKRKA